MNNYFPLILFLALAVVGCGTPPPVVPVEDPRSFLINELANAELRVWWEPYRNNDPEFLATIVDDTIEREEKTVGGMPADEYRLRNLVRSKLLGRYKSANDETEDGKAFIQARAKERFENPPIALKSMTATIDLHVLPGEWKSVSRTSDAMVNCPAIKNLNLTQDAIVHAVRKAKEEFPEATNYEITYSFFSGASRFRGKVQYGGGRIRRSRNTSHQYTVEEAAWDKLASGELDMEELKWEYPMQDS